MSTDAFENYGVCHPQEVAELLRSWARLHENENYHEFVVPLEALAQRCEDRTAPIQLLVMRHEDLFGTPLAEFYLDPAHLPEDPS